MTNFFAGPSNWLIPNHLRDSPNLNSVLPFPLLCLLRTNTRDSVGTRAKLRVRGAEKEQGGELLRFGIATVD